MAIFQWSQSWNGRVQGGELMAGFFLFEWSWLQANRPWKIYASCLGRRLAWLSFLFFFCLLLFFFFWFFGKLNEFRKRKDRYWGQLRTWVFRSHRKNTFTIEKVLYLYHGLIFEKRKNSVWPKSGTISWPCYFSCWSWSRSQQIVVVKSWPKPT